MSSCEGLNGLALGEGERRGRPGQLQQGLLQLGCWKQDGLARLDLRHWSRSRTGRAQHLRRGR